MGRVAVIVGILLLCTTCVRQPRYELKSAPASLSQTFRNLVTAIDSGQPLEAEHLLPYLEKKLTQSSPDQRGIVLGYIYVRQQQWERAIVALESAMTPESRYQPTAMALWAFAVDHSKNWNRPYLAFENYVKSVHQTHLQVRLVPTLIRLLAVDHHATWAEEWIDRLQRTRRASLSYTESLRADIHAVQHKSDLAIRHLLAAYEHVASEYDVDAIAQVESRLAIQDLNVIPSDRSWPIAQRMIKSRLYHDAARILRAHSSVSSPCQSRDSCEAWAKIEFGRRRYAVAAEHFDALSRMLVGSERHVARRMQATALARSEKRSEARSIYESLLRESNKESADILYKLAFLWMDEGKWNEAISAFQEWQTRIKSRDDLNRSDWLIGWCWYRLGKYKSAAESFQRMGARNPEGSVVRHKSQYWTARAFHKQGQSREAKSIFETVARYPSDGYYQRIARDRLAGHRWSGMAAMHSHSYVPEGDVWLEHPLEVDIDESGMIWAGRVEILDYIDRLSVRWQLDPALVKAIIWQESHFRMDVTSLAMARGLMQIIVPTARQLAQERDLKSFSIDRLFEPTTNVQLGTWYVHQLLALFNHQYPLVLAGYNAGEEAVMRWRRASPSLDMDEWIEEIPYSETNAYVKNISARYWPH